MALYESVIKINTSDDPRTRALHIAEGVEYACAILMDEYGFTSIDIMDIAERISDDAQDREASR